MHPDASPSTVIVLLGSFHPSSSSSLFSLHFLPFFSFFSVYENNPCHISTEPQETSVNLIVTFSFTTHSSNLITILMYSQYFYFPKRWLMKPHMGRPTPVYNIHRACLTKLKKFTYKWMCIKIKNHFIKYILKYICFFERR